MHRSKVYLSSVLSLLIAVFFFSSCNNAPKLSTSDVLEKALGSVVTVKLSETGLGKSAFGFADSGLVKTNNTADVAYEEILKLGNAKATGSGFIIEQNGLKYIITNAHVIERAKNLQENITAFTYDRKEHLLKLVGADSYYDIAVLSFVNEPDSPIAPLKIFDGNYRIGQPVYAIGNPLSYFPYTVTQGIISAKNRSGISSKTGYLQTTAMLSPGNSGGPLINESGELLGVNTLGSSTAGQLNFSLESKILKRVVNDIITSGKVKRAFSGIEVAQFYQYKLDKDQHVVVEPLNDQPVLYNILPNSPAASTLADNLGYHILKVNGQDVTSNDDLLGILETLKPKDKLKLSLEKDGITVERELVTDELSDNRLSQIGEFYFKSHYNISLEKNSSGIILNYPQGLQENTFQYYDKAGEKFISFRPTGERFYILACGNTKDMSELDIWKTDDYKDIGNALRLSAPTGQISFLQYDGKTAYIIRGLISDRKDIISKTILY